MKYILASQTSIPHCQQLVEMRRGALAQESVRSFLASSSRVSGQDLWRPCSLGYSPVKCRGGLSQCSPEETKGKFGKCMNICVCACVCDTHVLSYLPCMATFFTYDNDCFLLKLLISKFKNDFKILIEYWGFTKTKIIKVVHNSLVRKHGSYLFPVHISMTKILMTGFIKK